MTPFHALRLQSHIMIIDSDVLQTHSLIQVIGGFRHSRALVTGQQLSRPFHPRPIPAPSVASECIALSSPGRRYSLYFRLDLDPGRHGR
jgi:hypothetical protein